MHLFKGNLFRHKTITNTPWLRERSGGALAVWADHNPKGPAGITSSRSISAPDQRGERLQPSDNAQKAPRWDATLHILRNRLHIWTQALSS